MSSKWTAKLISKAAKLRKDSDDQSTANGAVNDFLYGAGGAPPPQLDLPPTQPALQTAPQPKLDLVDNDNGLGEPLPPPNPAYALPPLTKGKGIHVGFSDERPIVIGEGGDEAELPTSQVAKHTGQLSPTRDRDSGRPMSNGHDDSELHLGPGTATVPSVTVARAPTRKANTGPGFLQKRASFSFEEGQIQRQASNTDLASVAARQGFGQSLDPNALQPQLPVEQPPPTSVEKLQARQNSPLQKLSHAVQKMHDNQPGKRSPNQLWDNLLQHPNFKKAQSSTPSSPEPPAELPPVERQSITNGRSTGSALHPISNDTMPDDAIHGDFRRGSSPSRPAMQMPPRQIERAYQDQQLQKSYQAEVPPDSPQSSEYTPYSPVTKALRDMMGSDTWETTEAHQPTGFAPARQPPPGRGPEPAPQPVPQPVPSQQQPGLAHREELGPGQPNTAPMRPTGGRPTDAELNAPRPAGLESAPPSLGQRKPSITHQIIAPQYPSQHPSQHTPSQYPQQLPLRQPPPVRTERTNSFDRRPSDVPPPRPDIVTQGPRSGPPQGALPRPPSQHLQLDREPTIPILPPHPNGDALERHVSHTSSLDARTLGANLQPARSRGGSVEAQARSRPSSSRSAASSHELPADGLLDPRFGAVSPNAPPSNGPSPVQVYSPGRVPPPQQSPPGSIPQTVYQPSTGTTDNFRACIDALQSCFVHAEGDARALVGNHTAQWLRLASWWSLKGRKAFEVRIKVFNQNVAARSEGIDDSLRQPFIEVAKAWWITEQIIPRILRDPRSDFTQPSDGLEGPMLQQVYHTLKVQIETFISSVSRRHLLPAPEFLNVNFTSFFVQYPQLPTVIRTLTAGYNAPKDEEKPTDAPFFGIVLADTSRHFSYGHLFAETQVTLPHVGGDDDDDDDLVLPCVISLIRDKTMSQMEMVISTQDGQINLRVRADGRGLPSWNEVELRPKSHSVRIQLMAEFNIVIRLEKEDFKTLWGIREYNKQVMDEWSPARDERLIYETRLYDFNYIPPKGVSHPLPSNPIKDCAMRLYEKTDPPNADGKLIHRGHRMVVITSPDVKTLSNVSMRFDANFPILHSLLRGDQGAPALLLHIIQNDQPHRVIPAFRDPDDRNRFCEKLSGSYLANDEINIGTMKVTNISVSTAVPGTPGNLLDLPGVQWTDIHILSKMENGVDPRHSDRFRITADSNVGRLVDRPVIRPGELKIGLDALDLNSIKLRRSQDSSLVVALMENKLPNGLTAALQDAFKKKSTAASTIRYQFPSMADMHEFEEIVTGYRVLYDGITNHFSIKGQLKAAGLAKRLEATRTRIQIVQEEKKNTLQLLAFFKDMPDGACMSFGLTSTDHYEASHSSGKFYLRFVDARFGVPKPLSEPDATFVSLDMPEFAGERDDINVGFDTEEERERLVEALPAAPTKASGFTSFKHSLSNKFVDMQKTGGRPVSRQSQQG